MPADNEFENEEEPDADLCAQTIRDFVLHHVFEAFILVTIIVNGVTMVRTHVAVSFSRFCLLDAV